MNRSLLVLAVMTLCGCPRPTGAVPDAVPTAATVDAAAPATPPATTTTAAVLLSPSADAAARVQAIVPHWIELLERGDDASFLDEAVVPGELAKILDGKSKAEFVTTFHEDKHAGVLKMLVAIRGARPTKTREERDRTLVTYDLHGEKGVTFVVVGSSVYVKN